MGSTGVARAAYWVQGDLRPPYLVLGPTGRCASMIHARRVRQMSAFLETDGSTVQRMRIRGVVGASPEDVFDAFVRADRITQWWGDEAALDPVVGGAYEVRWPAMEWTVRGTYTEVAPGEALAFTWSWDHEPDTPERTVRITFRMAEDGTELTLSHGDYAATDTEERQSHLEGWQHFLPRLQNLFD